MRFRFLPRSAAVSCSPRRRSGRPASPRCNTCPASSWTRSCWWRRDSWRRGISTIIPSPGSTEATTAGGGKGGGGKGGGW